MIYIDPTTNPYFRDLAEVIQLAISEPTEITTDYQKPGTWILNYVSFKNGVSVNGPYIALQTEQMEIKGSADYRAWLKGAVKVWDWTDNLWFGYSLAYRLQAERAKNIDVLFYGAMNTRRQQIISEINRATGRTVDVVTDTYGADLWPIIQRAKIVLSIHHYDNPQNDMPRIAPLLSNGCFVICEATVDQKFNSITDLVIARRVDLAERVDYYLKHPGLRILWADKGRNWITKNPHANDRSA